VSILKGGYLNSDLIFEFVEPKVVSRDGRCSGFMSCSVFRKRVTKPG
jgi:hypothetical protein